MVCKMIYYFVSADGAGIEEDEQVRGWFDKKNNPDMFTVRRKAVAEARRRLKARIAELNDIFKELK